MVKSSALHNRRAWLPETIWLDPRVRAVTGAAKDLIVYLHICKNKKTGQIDPAIRTIAKDLCLAESTVWRALEELRAAGVIKTANRGRRESLLYSFPSVCPHADTTVCSHADTQPAPVSSFADRECLHSGQNASVPTQTEHSENTKKNTTTRSSPDGGSGGDAPQDSIEDVDQSEVYQALVKLKIGEPALSKVAKDPAVTAAIVRRAAIGDGEEEPGTGLILLNIEREKRAAKLRHDLDGLDRDARDRFQRYAEILSPADKGQVELIQGRWPEFAELAKADPIPGDRLFDLEPEHALNEIIDAAHASTA